MKEDTYHLAQGGQPTGPFTLAQVRAKWQTGEVTRATLFWRPGDPEWQPLGEIAFALGSMPSPAYPTMRPLPDTCYPPPTWSSVPQNSGLAVASFALGLASILLFVTFLPAIICGHLALWQIRQSGGQMGGRGFAVTGLVIGYLYMALIAAAGAAFYFSPAVYHPSEQRQQRAHLAGELHDAERVGAAVLAYARGHDDTTPATLEELSPTYLPNQSLLHPPGNTLPVRFSYVWPASKILPSDPKRILLRSVYTYPNHQAVFVYTDGSGEVKSDR